ncbi:hypothetical protein AA313_de0210277 [Arthrobotrys entomopaga]|nr:hypothetical protein AA313_de0210277 [Arthrobotrys entomopaga]
MRVGILCAVVINIGVGSTLVPTQADSVEVPPRYRLPFQPPGLRKRQEEAVRQIEPNLRETADSGSNITYTQKWFRQVTDHFDASNNNTFQQRYWISTQFYKPGGPVIVLEGGETSGAGRVSYMQTGVGRYLTEYLGGIGIVLEHRYYGKSYVTQNLTNESLKYLNTALGLKDNAYFAENLWKDLSANLSNIRPDKTPFISYGGSYAGAKSAFLQVAHPEAYYGSLASSAVVWAGENFWEYNEPVRLNGDPTCIAILQETSKRMDSYSSIGGQVLDDFKTLFGVRGVENRDAAQYIFGPLGYWQGGNWDKTQDGAKSWDRFCANITDGVNNGYFGAEKVLPGSDYFDLEAGIENFARWTRASVHSSCGDSNLTQCIGTGDSPDFHGTSLSDSWKLWQWQVCTEWGYFMPGAPAGMPTLMPRIVDLPYLRRQCEYAFNFPADFVIDSSKVLKYGGFNLTAPRLMYIDGANDPWLYATTHSPYSPQKDRNDRLSVLIPESWHHNDENGLGDISKEPDRIQKIHNLEIQVVEGWVKEFHQKRGKKWAPPGRY